MHAIAAAQRFGTPGPYTARPDLQLPSGMRTIDATHRKKTKAQSFDTTAARFTMNDAINCALQNLPDKQSPGPAAYNYKGQFEQSGARVLRRPGEGKSELPQRPATVQNGVTRRRPFLSAFEALTL